MQNDNEKKKIKKPSGKNKFCFSGGSAGRCRYIIPSDRSLIPVTVISDYRR